MAKIPAIVILVGILLVATLLVDRTACFVTKTKREEIKVGTTCDIGKTCINVIHFEISLLGVS